MVDGICFPPEGIITLRVEFLTLDAINPRVENARLPNAGVKAYANLLSPQPPSAALKDVLNKILRGRFHRLDPYLTGNEPILFEPPPPLPMK